MSRFGFVTLNDPPRASRDPKTTQNPAGPPSRDPKKMPRKIAKAARLIFQNWKARSHIKRNLNKLGYKRETSERCSNPLDPESTSSLASQETALRSLLIFDIGVGISKNCSWGCAEIFRIPGLTQKIALYAIATYNVSISVTPAAIIFMCHSKSE
jgi:hypothetical protein